MHQAAQRGFSLEAPTYAKGRPGYSHDILAWLTGDLQIGPGRHVLDMGAGTGKFTQLLAQTGAELCAVEPVGAMRAQLSQALPAVRTLAGYAEAIPLEAGWAHALVCAQAFHWFATEAALAEFHRVLASGGWLGLVWNVRDESVDWVAALTAIVTPHEGDAPRFYKGDWRKPFNGRYFSDLTLRCFDYQHVGTPQQVIIDRFMSVSFIAALPPADKAAVHAQLQELVATHPELRGQEQISFPYRTEAYRAQRLDEA